MEMISSKNVSRLVLEALDLARNSTTLSGVVLGISDLVSIMVECTILAQRKSFKEETRARWQNLANLIDDTITTLVKEVEDKKMTLYCNNSAMEMRKLERCVSFGRAKADAIRMKS